MFGGSHYLLFRRIGEELGNRGHKVTMLLSSAQHFKPSDKFTIKIYQVPYEPGFEEKFIEKSVLKDKNDTKKEEPSGFQKLNSFAEFQANFCRGLLDLEGIKDLDLKPDIIVGDSHFSCSGVVSDLFDVKLVLICPSGLTHAMLPVFKSPNPLSYAPQPFTGLSDKMSFTERLVNLAGFLLANIIGRVFMFPAIDKVKQQYNIQPEVSAGEALGKAELYLVQSHFALDFPRPLTPAIIVTGPLLPQPAKALPHDLENFFTSSGDDGVIVVAFGSMVSSLPPKTLNMLAKVLSRMKQKVLWKIKGNLLTSKTSNIKTVDWMPQNEVLGHANTKVFLSHVGHNSMYEAAFHGVPIVGFPMWGDQPENARQIVRAGMGLWVDINSVTEDELYKAISRVLTEPSFRKNATRVSALIKDQRRTPLELTGDWIEFVLRHNGAPHLRVQAFNMPWYQEHLIDVALFIFSIFTCTLLLLTLCCRCLCKVCRKGGHLKAKKE
ncbi:hypothetical protein ACROYT_G029004 [Oculina patagonica]